MKYDIFISYRREGGYDTAKHLYDLLDRDGYRVSFDIDTLRSGSFDTQLYERIDQCKDFLLIIDPHAFDRTLDKTTEPKSDWLRCELSYALKQDKNIIPVFLQGVSNFPKNLPEDVVAVTKKNGPEYSRYHFNAFYKELKSRFLLSKPKKNSLARLIALFAVIAAVCGLAAYFLTDKTDDDLFELETGVEFYDVGTVMDFKEHKLYAKVDGYQYNVNLPEDKCFDLVTQDDFDGDGITDALVMDVVACGGNSYGNSFFFVTYTGNGYFNITNEFGDDVWADPIVEDWKGEKSVVVVNTNQGVNQDENYQVKERYVLRQGRAIRVESSKKNEVVAMLEIRNSDFYNGKESETISLDYNLDENGETDFIECTYWERWDKMLVDVVINGVHHSECSGVYRIGILSSETNGVNDLVLDADDIWKWNGSEYVASNQ